MKTPRRPGAVPEVKQGATGPLPGLSGFWRAMSEATGYIEVDMFSADVTDRSHPQALEFRELLEDVASEYDCSLISFDVVNGTVIFSFDIAELTAEIFKILRQGEKNEF